MSCDPRHQGIEVKRTAITETWYLIIGNYIFTVDRFDQLVDAVMFFACRGLPVHEYAGTKYAPLPLKMAGRMLSFGFRYDIRDKDWSPSEIDREIIPRWTGNVVGKGVPYTRQPLDSDPQAMRPFVQRAVDDMLMQLLQETLEAT